MIVRNAVDFLARRSLGLAVLAGVALSMHPWVSRAAGPASRPATVPVPLVPGDHLRALTVDGRRRTYTVHLPPAYDPAKPTAVVVAFHGALMNGPMMATFTGLNDTADKAGFAVVYPDGVGFGQAALFFNASVPPVTRGPPDDVRFTREMLDNLERAVTVDRKRVFATGMSNGGMMANRVGAELADRFAAIAPVAGTLALPAIHPSRAVPAMIFHGTADAIVPFDGPRGQTPTTMRFRSVTETVDAWRAADGCNGEGVTVETPDAARDGTTVSTTTYAGGRDGAEVVLVTVRGGGHTWPGSQPPVRFIGVSTRNGSANDLMWAFFQRHPMP